MFNPDELAEEKEIFKIDSDDDSDFDDDSDDSHEWFDSDVEWFDSDDFNIPESENEF